MSDFEFAVVVPARNGMPDVIEAVASALGQTHAPAEVVVVDDGSTDGTGAEIARRYGGRVRVTAGTYGSAAAARNAGWRATRAPWIALLDADDLWFPEKLATAARLLAGRPEAAWFFSDGCFRTIDGELHPSWFALHAELPEPYFGQPVEGLFAVNFVLTSSVVMRREALAAAGGFDESMSHAEDLDLWIRLARRWPAVATTRALVQYQHRAGGLTRQVEARLGGSRTLFQRLAAEAALAPALRQRARRRAAMSSFKLALHALRDGRRGDARRHLREAWIFPQRAVAVAALWAATLLPTPLLERLRRQGWASRDVVAPIERPRRVVLHGTPPAPAG